MVNTDESSYGSCMTNDHDLSDVIVGYHSAGADATSSKVIWDSLVDTCKRSIGRKFLIGKKEISEDLDAYSFVISTEEMNSTKKHKLREFLLSFGDMSFGRCSFPTKTVGSKSKDSMFGCCGNKSQHLPPILQGNEMLVIDVPLIFALHHSCQSTLIENLKSRGFYFTPASINTGVCFNPYAAANKPPYIVMVDAIIDSCEVTRKETGATNSTHIIHIADMGFCLPLANNFDSVNN